MATIPSVPSSELKVLNVLWENGPSTAREVWDRLQPTDQYAYSTVITLLRRLEEKGAVRHAKSNRGKAFIFHPILKREQARNRAVRAVMKRYFEDNPASLVAALVDSRNLTPEDIAELRALLDRAANGKEKQS